MKEQYMRQVKKRLKVPRRKKREILRDLEETFASAAEHGETERQVLDRLGTPKAFAAAFGAYLEALREVGFTEAAANSEELRLGVSGNALYIQGGTGVSLSHQAETLALCITLGE